jgi:hypothetical protein
MDAVITLAGRNFALTSMSGTSSARAAREATPDLPNTLEISHSTNKGGVRRSVVRVNIRKKNPTTLLTKELSMYVVLSRDVSFFDEVDIDTALGQITAFLGTEAYTDALYNGEV